MPTDEQLHGYQNHRVMVLPYDEKRTDIFPEDFLGRLYYKLKADGTLPLAFPGMDMTHLNRFMTHMANIRYGFVIGSLKTLKKPHPVGWAYLTELDGDENNRVASFAFGFTKEVHGRREHVDISFYYLKFWFDNFNLVQLYGTTLNPLALNYSKRFGFQKLCTLPKRFNGVEASLITLTPETFLRYYERWKLTTTPPVEVPTPSLV